MKTKTLFLSLFVVFASGLQAQLTLDWERADSLYVARNQEAAIAAYQDMLKSYPETVHRFYFQLMIANCYYDMAAYAESETTVKQAMKIDKDNSDYNFIQTKGYWLLSRIASRRGNEKKSLKLIIKASEYSDDTYILNNIGYSYTLLGEYDKALEFLARAIYLDTQNAYAYNNRALTYYLMGDMAKARADVEKSIEMNPQNPYAFKHSGMIYLAEGETFFACRDLNKAIELGYREKADEFQRKEVDDLLAEHCQNYPSDK